MPHIDARSGEIVIRIVYDGAPEAGKTTNVQRLGQQISLQRRGAQKSPGTTGDRTEFFDWLDFAGGYLDGRRVRCQLVSVPGQPRLLHRRRYLLEKADAIVFVADSRETAFAEARANFATTAQIVERIGGAIPLGLVLQANKQDLGGALGPVSVAAAIAPTATTHVVGAIAAEGVGTMETFILAVRLATERVRTLFLGTDLTLSLAAESAETLHEAMTALAEESAPALVEEASAPAPVVALEAPVPDAREAALLEAERREAELAAAERVAAQTRPTAGYGDLTDEADARAPEVPTLRTAGTPLPETLRPPSRAAAAKQDMEPVVVPELPAPPVVEPAAPIVEAAAPPSAEPPRGRSNSVNELTAIGVPHPDEIISGHVWPPVKGRALLGEATTNLEAPDEVRPWAPRGAFELGNGRYRMHSRDRWVYGDESTARTALLALVRRILPIMDVVPDGRALAVARERDHWRLWLVTPDLPSLVDVARDVLARESTPVVAAFLRRALEHLRALARRGVTASAFVGGAAALAEQDGRPVLLSWTDDAEDLLAGGGDPAAELVALLERSLDERSELRDGTGGAELREIEAAFLAVGRELGGAA